jgi:hypothetical protein
VGVVEGVEVGVGVKGSRPKLTEVVSPALTAMAAVLEVVLVKPAGRVSTN